MHLEALIDGESEAFAYEKHGALQGLCGRWRLPTAAASPVRQAEPTYLEPQTSARTPGPLPIQQRHGYLIQSLRRMLADVISA
jgi:hypothetical protein